MCLVRLLIEALVLRHPVFGVDHAVKWLAGCVWRPRDARLSANCCFATTLCASLQLPSDVSSSFTYPILAIFSWLIPCRGGYSIGCELVRLDGVVREAKDAGCRNEAITDWPISSR